MDSNRFNQILVVDSIPTGEYNTARRLFEDLETYATAYSPSPAVRYVRVENAAEFFQCVLMSKKDTEEHDIVPMLHASSAMAMKMAFSLQMVLSPIGTN